MRPGTTQANILRTSTANYVNLSKTLQHVLVVLLMRLEEFLTLCTRNWYVFRNEARTALEFGRVGTVSNSSNRRLSARQARGVISVTVDHDLLCACANISWWIHVKTPFKEVSKSVRVHVIDLGARGSANRVASVGSGNTTTTNLQISSRHFLEAVSDD